MKTLPLAVISATIITATTTVSAQQQPEFKWGGDIRLRTVYIDDVPMANGTSYDESSFQRYRTRLWTEFHPSENLFLNARFINEFRTQQTGDRANGWERYDETVIDNLFIDYQNDLFDLRIGRQDMTYGTGKLILDGTPMDGSRSIYFDAIKVTYKGFENTTVDLFAMYTKAENELALNSENRNLVWNTNPAYDGAEAGGGVYIKNSSIDDLPWESYWILKTQEDGLSDDTHTAGARLMPKIAENITGNLEFAYQSDTEDLDGFMIDALATFSLA